MHCAPVCLALTCGPSCVPLGSWPVNHTERKSCLLSFHLDHTLVSDLTPLAGIVKLMDHNLPVPQDAAVMIYFEYPILCYFTFSYL